MAVDEVPGSSAGHVGRERQVTGPRKNEAVVNLAGDVRAPGAARATSDGPMIPSTTSHLYTAAREYWERRVDEADQATTRGGNEHGQPRGWGWFAAVAGVSLGLWALIIWGATTLYRIL